MTQSISRRGALLGAALVLPASAPARSRAADGALERIVEETVRPLMARHDVPGLAVAVTAGGRRHVFAYGVASRRDRRPVSADTLFEIGSISKAFTASLGCLAQARGALSLADPAGRHLPALAGSSLARVSLVDHATYTAGGLPLQLPAQVTDEASMLAFFRAFRPTFAPGTHRLYSNPSIGLFGHLAARSLGRPFARLIEEDLIPALGLTRTHIHVPRERMGDYAFGHAAQGRQIRALPGVLAAEAYGVKASAADLIRFVEASIDPAGLGAELGQALAATQTGQYGVGGMMQGLGWELYAYPTPLDALLAGNAPQIVFGANAVTRPAPAPAQVLVNKTGSTGGFGAYVAFVPARRIGVALLANRNYPGPARVTAAHRILAALAG